MTRCWLALVDSEPRGAFASATVTAAAGSSGSVLAVWRQRAKPTRGALRCDERIVDRQGAAAWASLVLAPPGIRVPFDDLSVQQARRELLSRPPFDAVSTLLLDDSHFEGSIVLARGPHARHRLTEDPFSLVFPAQLLQVECGVLGSVAAPTGPTIERYGSANPWPWDRFSRATADFAQRS
jgi:hypothetical protein